MIAIIVAHLRLINDDVALELIYLLVFLCDYSSVDNDSQC